MGHANHMGYVLTTLLIVSMIYFAIIIFSYIIYNRTMEYDVWDSSYLRSMDTDTYTTRQGHVDTLFL